ncbi:MAG: CHAT domain-containing protein [Anaerolineae bacterium]|nr:CHAT domain-containing protein [Anaerolineae bacterium]MDW8100196.1 CHAT domain-containing protein [Anaerolineae bacterium]
MDDYADLDIVIQDMPVERGREASLPPDFSALPIGGTTYPVSASYAGQRAASLLTLDPAAPPWPEWQTRLADALEAPGTAFLHQVGSALYRALFRDEIAHLWTIAQAELEAGRVPGVRIRLAVDPPAIAALPWELLYDEQRQRSIACHPQHPLIRAIGRVGQTPPWRDISLTLPLRALFVAPQEANLDWTRELSMVQNALARLDGQAELRPLTGEVTLARFSDVLGEWRPHVVHFVTHGDFDGLYGWLMFSPSEGDSGAGWTRSDQLRTLLDARGESVRLVILGVCQSARVFLWELDRDVQRFSDTPREPLYGLGPALIQAGVPAVIGMQFEIREEAALLFTHALYRGLLEPRRLGQIDAAVAEARAELKAQWPDQPAYAAPVLFLNAPHGQLFKSAGVINHALSLTAGESPRAPSAHPTGTLAPRVPPLSWEEASSRFAYRTLRELRREIRVLTERVQNLQAHLDLLRIDREASARRSSLESQIAEDMRELEVLRRAVRVLEEAGVPEELTIQEFEAGELTAAVLETAVAEQPYEQAFYAADVARWIATAYPAYWERVIQHAGGQSEAEQAVFHQLAAMAEPGNTPASRPWFLIRHGSRFKRAHY